MHPLRRIALASAYLLTLAAFHTLCDTLYQPPHTSHTTPSTPPTPTHAPQPADTPHTTPSSDTPAAAASPAAAACDTPPQPFHTLLTAQATTYQQWQSRIMYYHYKKQRSLAGPCSDMGGFTRLVSSPGGKPDGIEVEIPSVFYAELGEVEMRRYGHFAVLNRPLAVVRWLEGSGLARVPEPYIYIAETDHVLLKPLRNLAAEAAASGEEHAAAFFFHYMQASRRTIEMIRPVAHLHSRLASLSHTDIQPIGPSPVILRKHDLVEVAPLWLNLSLALKLNPETDKAFGWVLEMWGYSLAAAALGIRHRVRRDFQQEPSGGYASLGDTYIFHYTYGVELSMKTGRPMAGIGEWSIDKRHYGSAYPPRNLQPPPARHAVAEFLHAAWNEATSNISAWPETLALGTVGWRRNKNDGVDGSALGAQLVGSRWSWAKTALNPEGIRWITFSVGGTLGTPWGDGVWGVLPPGRPGEFCAPPAECAFADFSNSLHNVRFDFASSPATLKTFRVGDGESVVGERAP